MVSPLSWAVCGRGEREASAALVDVSVDEMPQPEPACEAVAC
ncbi:hypothetical protein [Microbacterium pullorum]|nr:hypothetical protein [Microbacterium pullorum]